MHEEEVDVLHESALAVVKRRRGVCWVSFGDAGGGPLVWTPELESQLFTGLDVAAEDPLSSVIVVASRGQDFCRGADISLLRNRLDNPHNETAEAVLKRRVTRLLHAPKLTIAAIHGHCIGIGLAFALTCDVRIAHDSAKFQTGFGRRGLVAEHASAWLLPRIVGMANALELMLLSETIDAQRAVQMGLASRVVSDLEGTVVAIATSASRELAPESISVMKRMVYGGSSMTFDEALADAAGAQSASMKSAAAREGVESFLEKRPANFWPQATD